MAQFSVPNGQPTLALTEVVQNGTVFPTRDPNTGSLGTFYGQIALTAAPTNYYTFAANGAQLPTNSNQALFALLGASYGGNGNTTFNLPNLVGRVAVGQGVGQGIGGFNTGQTFGETSNVVSRSQTSPLIGGSSQPVDAYQPSLGITYLINTLGTFPARGQPADLKSLGFITASAAGPDVQAGERVCDGSLLSINSNQALFSILGTRYGGDGITTFALPDLRGRDVVGAGTLNGTPYVLGQTLGAPTYSIQDVNLPKTGNQQIPIQQPGVVMNYLICTTGRYPSRDSMTVGTNADPDLGQIVISAGDVAPSNFALCNGQTLSIAQNQALFSLLGTAYGGNGITTFALPNLQGRAVVGAGSDGITSVQVGEQSGSATQTLVANQLPAPTLTSFNGVATNNGASDTFTLTFSGKVANATEFATDFTVNTTGSVSYGTPIFAPVGAPGPTLNGVPSYSSYTYSFGGVTGTGTLSVSFAPQSTIIDASGNAVASATYTSNILNIAVVPSAPQIVSDVLAAHPAATLVNAGTFTFNVTFDQAVTVNTGGNNANLSLALNNNRSASYSSISQDGKTLTFSYTVGANDDVADLKATGFNPLQNGAAIRSNGSLDADLGRNFAVIDTNTRIDTTAPTISAVTLNQASYKFGDTVTATIQLAGATDGNGSYTLGAGATLDGQVLTAGSYDSSTNRLTASFVANTTSLPQVTNASVPDSIVVTDAAGNASAVHTSGTGTAATIDTIAPTVGSVSGPADGIYGTGQALTFTVNYSEPVTVTGTPQLPVTLDTGAVQASYTGGSGTNALTFTYTVASGNTDTNGIGVGQAITANGGTLRDSVGNDASLTLANVGQTGNVRVDGVAPTVSSIAIAGTSPNNAASEVYTVTFAEPVTGVDAGDFRLTSTNTASGGLAAVAATNAVNGYASVYTVTVNGVTGDGTLRLDLNASNTGITDVAGNAFTAGFTTGQVYTVDHTAPAQPGVPTLLAASDSGPINSDHITNVATPTVTGSAEIGATVALYDGAGTTPIGTGVATNGTYSITPTAGLAAGAHPLTVTATDAAGNTSAASSPLGVTIDTTAPALSSSSINGNVLTLTYTETGSGLYAGPNVAKPAAGDYAVTVGNQVDSVTAVAVDATAKTVTLTLTSAVATSDVVGLAYTAGADPGALRDIAGNPAANLSLPSVSNVTPLPPPSGGGGGGGSANTATDGPDRLAGTLGDDTIAGLGGNDTISGDDGNDLLYGNQGNDSIVAGSGNNTVYGGVGDDIVSAGSGNDLLFGNEGADTISAGDGNNTLVGGQDSTDGADLITSGAGNDLIFGNGGDDSVAAGAGQDIVVGGFGNDILFGNQGNDLIYGNQGSDIIFGGMGDDTLIGGQGDDTLTGGEGNDVIYGNEGADRIVFGINSGNDRVMDFSPSDGDRLDLQGQTYTTTTDASGNAVLTLSGGGMITLAGIAGNQVNAGIFA